MRLQLAAHKDDEFLNYHTNMIFSELCISACALEVIFNEMRYTNLRFTYLLTYLSCRRIVRYKKETR